MSKFVIKKVIRDGIKPVRVYEWSLVNKDGEVIAKSLGCFDTLILAKENIAEVKKCAKRFAKVEVENE